MVLVTGAQGFLGSAIVELLVKQSVPVRALVRSAHASNGMVDYQVADIADRAAMVKAMEGVSVVIHAAGLAHKRAPAEQFHQVNAVGTANVMEAAVRAKVKRFVLVSSVSVYGSRPPADCSEQHLPRPETPYAHSKLKAEQIVSNACSRADISAALLRMATVYGEGDRGNLSHLIAAAKRGLLIPVGHGRNRKTLIYRWDAARACVLAAQRTDPGRELFNVGESSYTMRAITAAVFQSLGRRERPWIDPTPALRTLRPFLEQAPILSGPASRAYGLLDKWTAETSFATDYFKTAYGFEPKTPLQEGLPRQIAAA